MDNTIDPVVTEKEIRGREMKTDIIPTGVFDTMKYISTKKTAKTSLVPELEEPNDKKVEMYHEGYVDGQLYLVPDSTLEAMKDIVNLTMRPRRSTRYKHQTSFELTDYDHFRGKLTTLLQNIEGIETEISEEESEEEEEEEQKTEEESFGEEEVLPPPPPPKPTPLPTNVLRFLISGHFREDKQHIYIIQDYRGGPDLFKDQKGDFYTKQKHDEIDISLSGRFYNKKILEEYDGKPIALNTGSHRIYIDERTSDVYEHYFKQVYKFNTVDIFLKGEFITSKITKKITPFLTIDFKQKTSAEPNIISEKDYSYARTPSSNVLVYKPIAQQASSKKIVNNTDRGSLDLSSTALVLQSTVAVMSPYRSNTNAGPSTKESSQNKIQEKGDEKNLKTIVSVKPYTIYTSNLQNTETLGSNYSNNQHEWEENISQESNHSRRNHSN